MRGARARCRAKAIFQLTGLSRRVHECALNNAINFRAERMRNANARNHLKLYITKATDLQSFRLASINF